MHFFIACPFHLLQAAAFFLVVAALTKLLHTASRCFCPLKPSIKRDVFSLIRLFTLGKCRQLKGCPFNPSVHAKRKMCLFLGPILQPTTVLSQLWPSPQKKRTKRKALVVVILYISLFYQNNITSLTFITQTQNRNEQEL